MPNFRSKGGKMWISVKSRLKRPHKRYFDHLWS